MPDIFITRDAADKDMLMAAAFIGERIKSNDGHAEAMISIVPMLLERGDVDLAAELSNAVDDPYSRDGLLALVAEKCAELKDDEYALQLVEAIEDHGMQGRAMERVAMAKVAAGEIDRAIELSDAITHADTVLAAAATAAAASGDAAKADAIIDGIDFPAAQANACISIAAANIESGDTSTAAEYLDRAISYAESIEHDVERLRALCEAGTQFIAASRNDRAVETFTLAHDQALTISTTHRNFFLSMAALGYRSAGSVELAESALGNIADKTQIASTLMGFARETWRDGDKETAIDDLTEAYEMLRSQHERETRDTRAKNALMSAIAIQFAGFGKTETAIEIANENQDDEQRIAAITQIGQILAFQNESQLANETVASIDEDSRRALGFAAIAKTYIEADKIDLARTALNEASSRTTEVEQPSARADVYLETAARYAELGDLDAMRRESLSGLSSIASILDAEKRASSIARFAALYNAHETAAGQDEMTAIRASIARTLA
jgi:tetratricopeptide (TPR) repeat protein